MKRSFLLVLLIGVGAAACSASKSEDVVPSIPVAALPASAIPAEANPEQTILPGKRSAVSSRPVTRLGQGGYAQSTFTINSKGATFKFPTYDGLSGTGYYPANNAPPSGAKLQVTNSGSNNLIGVPPSATAQGTVVFYFEAQLSGAAYQVTFHSSTKTMQLRSTQLQSTATYAVAAYLWNKELEYYNVGSPSNGLLVFPNPFSGLTMSYYTPIAFELLVVSNATPTPSPTPTPQPTPTPTPQPTPTPTPQPTPTPTPQPTPTPTPQPTPTPTPQPTPTPNPTPTPTPTPYPQTLYAAYGAPSTAGSTHSTATTSAADRII